MRGKSLLSAHQSGNQYPKYINCKNSAPKLHLVSKCADELDRYFSKEVIQIANRYLKEMFKT